MKVRFSLIILFNSNFKKIVKYTLSLHFKFVCTDTDRKIEQDFQDQTLRFVSKIDQKATKYDDIWRFFFFFTIKLFIFYVKNDFVCCSYYFGEQKMVIAS